MRLDVRPKRDAGCCDLLSETLRIAFDHIQVDDESWSVETVW